MATKAHCAYCFEALAANFEGRKPLSLAQVEDLWEQYHSSSSEETGEDDAGLGAEDDDASTARPAAISRLLNRDDASSKVSSSSNSSSSVTSRDASGSATPTSSMSSTSSLPSTKRKRESHPLFVTWNTHSRSGEKRLRGCIGTFAPLELEEGLRSYSLTSALEDHRFNPIPASLLPSLSNHVTLLTNFSQPTKDPLDWTLGTHGMRISFNVGGKRYGATYLPDVAVEQGWTKEEAVLSLMRKAGWNGSSGSWMRTWKDGKGELVRYEGKAVGLEFAEYKEWRDWVEGQNTKTAS